MKKLNEDVVINDPNLAQQYANGQTQLLNKDKQINALQQQINNIEQSKNEISKKMAEIEQKAASSQGNDQQQNQQNQQTVQVTGSPVQQTSESLLIKEEEISDNILDQLYAKYDNLSDEIAMMINNGFNINIIKNARIKLKDLEQQILSIEYSDSIDEAEKERFSGKLIDTGGGKLYHGGKFIGYEQPEYTDKKMSDKQYEKAEKIDDEIYDLKNEISYYEEEIQELSDNINNEKIDSLEAENFYGQVIDTYGWNVLDFLNSGNTNIKKLKSLGVEDPEELIADYKYYHPESDNKLVAKNKKEIKDWQKKLDAANKKLEKLEDKSRKAWTPGHKTKYKFKSAQAWDSQDQNRMAPNVYDNQNPLAYDNFYNLSEAYIDDITFDDSNIGKYQEYNNYVFYVKLSEDHNEFIGKIFKLSPDGEWYGVVKDGEDSKFENMTYDPSYDEDDIIEFLKETYDEVEVIDINEFDNYIDGDTEEF